jgi:hypothetical protein
VGLFLARRKNGGNPREVYMIGLLFFIGYVLVLVATMVYMHDRFGETEVMVEIEKGIVSHVHANFPISLTIVDWDTQDDEQEMNAHAAYNDAMSIEGMTLVY